MYFFTCSFARGSVVTFTITSKHKKSSTLQVLNDCYLTNLCHYFSEAKEFARLGSTTSIYMHKKTHLKVLAVEVYHYHNILPNHKSHQSSPIAWGKFTGANITLSTNKNITLTTSNRKIHWYKLACSEINNVSWLVSF